MAGANELLMRFWRRLHEQGIPYCVVGDVQDLPERVNSDVDMVIPQPYLHGMAEFVLDFCEENHARLAQCLVHEHSAVYFVLAWLDNDGIPHFLALDFCSDFMRRGRRLLDADELLRSRIRAVNANGKVRGFYTAAPAINFIYYLLKKIDKNQLDVSHGKYLSTLWRIEPENAADLIGRFWSQEQWRRLLYEAAWSGNWEPVRRMLPHLRRDLHRTCRRTWRDGFRELIRQGKRWYHPTGVSLAVLGADGSGKTALINTLCADWAPAFRQVRYLHLRPRLLARQTGANTAVNNPHGRKARSSFASLIKLIWFVFDYVIGYAVRIRPWMVRSGLVVFDRYFDDLYLDPARYRFGANIKWAIIAARLIPRPALWLVLEACADTLQARKQEVTHDASMRQQRAYHAFCKHIIHCHPIDADLPLDKVRTQANARVLAMLGARVEAVVQRKAWKNPENPAGSRFLLALCRRDIPFLSRAVRILFNSDIYCRFPWPPYIPHPYGIIIHSHAGIGRGVTIMQQVTIGGKQGSDQAPDIGSGVYIGAGAKILGGIHIGRGAIIGANAVVTRNVNAGATIVGANQVLPKNNIDLRRKGDSVPVEISLDQSREDTWHSTAPMREIL